MTTTTKSTPRRRRARGTADWHQLGGTIAGETYGHRCHPSLVPLLEPIEAVKTHPKNARRGVIPSIRESMRVNGVYRPVIAQRSTGYALAGNHTFTTLKEDGAEQVPVVWVDVDAAGARKIMLADNRTAELGDYDDRALLDLLDVAGDLEGTGYVEDDRELLRLLLDRDHEHDEDVQGILDRADRTALPWVKVQLDAGSYERFQNLPGDEDREKLLYLLGLV